MTGTVMERSHAKLTQWAAAFHLAASSKKGFSAHQLHRELGCPYNTAWFLHHRVMEAMRRGGLDLPPFGGDGKVVEADETYFGKLSEEAAQKLKTQRPSLFQPKLGSGPAGKRAVIALVERGGQRSLLPCSAMLLSIASSSIVRKNIARELPVAHRRKPSLP